jgi:hypothetical protein
VLRVNRSALTAQQLHITAACQMVHGHLPGFWLMHSTPADATTSSKRCDSSLQEMAARLTDALRAISLRYADLPSNEQDAR